MPEIPKAYNPEEVEDKIYKIWEESGKFNPDNLDLPANAEKFSIAMPPPNATGILHVGHASMLAYQDLMIRYNRLKGKRTLWLPGTDHAAIATQTVVEKLIAKEGKTKYDLGREKFLKRVNEYIEKSRSTIKSQIRKMGSSCDWSRERYTLDPGLSQAVKEVFVKMYRDGLIYRGYRIVNWCPRCESTLADDEVEYKEEKMPFYYFKYGPIIIGTARPETKFADKIIVVHPDDMRYKNLIGKTFTVPWIEGDVEAKVIADPAVDKDFGTGAMTITPAHSFEDFELAQKYGIEVVKIIDEKGNLTKVAGSFAGMNANKARAAIVEKMKQGGLVDHIDENYIHNLSVCYRCGAPIEPLPSLQWFVDVNKKITIRGNKYFKNKSLKEVMLKAVKGGEVKIIPERFEKIYFHWIENLRDWCVSRQLWFGHRIPVWYRDKSKVISQKSKVWDLKIYGKDIFNAIKEGTKKIETRAGRPKGSEKYWGDFKEGDIIKFSLADEKTDKIINLIPPIEKIIKKVVHFNAIDEMFKVYKSEDDYPGKSINEVKQWWKRHPALYERILKYGIWAFELADLESEQIYVGVEAPQGEGWVQDSDTLDTWFSSGMWTFSTLLDRDFKKYKTFEEWMKSSPDLKKFHPTSVMETGYDILFFWIARMILMAAYAVGEIPFETVYLHGMVRDKQGRKMSKSLGNGIDPVDMIKKYGTDALRLSMIIGSAPGSDIKLYEEKIAGYRNFANKLWNISRYILSAVDVGKFPPADDLLPRRMRLGRKPLAEKAENKKPKAKTITDQWVLEKMEIVASDVSAKIENYEFSAAGEILRDFTWNDFADWYLETAKIEKGKDEILVYILKNLLKLWHPFMPFVTENIWSLIRGGKNKLLMAESWPSIAVAASRGRISSEAEFNLIKSIITSIRNLRSENKIDPALKIKAIFIVKGKRTRDLIESQKEVIKGLARLSDFTVETKKGKIAKAVSVFVDGVEIYLPLEGAIDVSKEIERIEKEMAENEKIVRELAGRLANKNFLAKAKREVVEETREKLKNSTDAVNQMKNRKKSLS